jgi:hypothetical protein
MHNFATSTCFTLSNNAELREIWRTSIPGMAFAHRCLLKAMLALSALHIAHFRPEKREFYQQFAALHNESALREGASMIANISEENCSAVLIFSLLATLNDLAAPRKEDSLLLVGDSGIADWLYTIRGMGQIAKGSWERLSLSVIAPLIRIVMRDLDRGSSETPPEAPALESLKSSLEKMEIESSSANIAAVDQLLANFSAVHNRARSSCEMPAILSWPCQVPDGYIELLRESEPWSLVVLAYFCALLKKGDLFWWMEGWPVHILGYIYQSLGDEYRLAIRWPMETIGWVPPNW